MNTPFLFRTDYFTRRWTWIARVMRFIVALALLYVVDLQELKNGENIQVFGYLFLVVLGIIFLLFPTDDLVLDKDNFYIIRRSLFAPLNRTLTYRVADVKGIGVYNISAAPGVFTLLAPVHEVNRIEITFADDSSTSRDVTVS